ncbi:MAG: LysR family transcriptional regulator [Pseudomonadales bacterium]
MNTSFTHSANLRHLRAALEVDRLGSISGASRSIHLSQPTLTQGIRELEKGLGTALFERSTSGVITTVPGKAFLRRVARGQRWLSAIDNLSAASTSRRVDRKFTTRQLRALVTVTQEGSYTRAAQRLDLTQPTLHRAIRDFESICQLTLFQRVPQGVEPSWRAKEITRLASLFFAELNQGIDELNEACGILTSSIRIGALPLSRTELVPAAVIELLKIAPESQVSIIDGPFEEQLHSLLHGQIDFIIGALRQPASSKDIEQELLFKDPLSIVVRKGHQLTSNTTSSIKELRKLSWIAPRLNTPAREAFNQMFHREGLESPESVVECSSLVATRGLLLNSDRAALLPARQVEIDVTSGLLAVSPVILKGTDREIGIMSHKDWQATPLQQTFLKLIRDHTSMRIR